MKYVRIVTGLFALVAVLVGCTGTTDSVDREAVREAVIAELLYRLDQLQALDMARIEVDPEIRIIADAACSALVIGSPYLTAAVNQRLAERAEGGEAAEVTADEMIGTIHDICSVVRAVMVDKAAADPAPPAS